MAESEDFETAACVSMDPSHAHDHQVIEALLAENERLRARIKKAETAAVPHHGGTPTQMLRDLARFLDGLDDAGDHMVFARGPHEGKTLSEALRGQRANQRTMQSDVRWLADRLEESFSDSKDTDRG